MEKSTSIDPYDTTEASNGLQYDIFTSESDFRPESVLHVLLSPISVFDIRHHRVPTGRADRLSVRPEQDRRSAIAHWHEL